MHSEYARQREHLERSVASLRKKLSKDSEIHRGDTIRVMQVLLNDVMSHKHQLDWIHKVYRFLHQDLFMNKTALAIPLFFSSPGKCFSS